MEGAFLRERQCIGAAGAFGFFMVVVYGNFDLNPGCNSRTEFHRRERRRCGCCWNVEVSFWVESFDANGGALVLRERRLPSGDAARVWHRQGGLVARCFCETSTP